MGVRVDCEGCAGGGGGSGRREEGGEGEGWGGGGGGGVGGVGGGVGGGGVGGRRGEVWVVGEGVEEDELHMGVQFAWRWGVAREMGSAVEYDAFDLGARILNIDVVIETTRRPPRSTMFPCGAPYRSQVVSKGRRGCIWEWRISNGGSLAAIRWSPRVAGGDSRRGGFPMGRCSSLYGDFRRSPRIPLVVAGYPAGESWRHRSTSYGHTCSCRS